MFGFFEFYVWTQSKIKHKSPAYLVTFSAVIHVSWRTSMCLPHYTSRCTLEFKIPFQPGKRHDCGQLLTCFQSCSPPWRNIVQFQGFFYLLKSEFFHAQWWDNRILEVYRTQPPRSAIICTNLWSHQDHERPCLFVYTSELAWS